MVGSNPVQYREYQRSAQADQRNVLTEKDGSEAISAIINPCTKKKLTKRGRELVSKFCERI
jgi:hypothetical protein